MTVYNFYAWPTNVRPRVAQVLVLPPYQGAGIGKALLAAAYRLARDRGANDLVVRSFGEGTALPPWLLGCAAFVASRERPPCWPVAP